MNEGAHYSLVRMVDFNANYLIKIYPNPATNVLNVYAAADLGKSRLRIRNMAGQLIKEQSIKGNGTLAVSLGGLSRGIYSIEITGESTNFRSIFVKE